MNALIVSREEAGQKLLNFLQRRLEAANGGTPQMDTQRTGTHQRRPGQSL